MSDKRYAYAKKGVTSWSYSRYRDYKHCPLYFKLKHLDKVPDGPPEGSPAMARGSAIGAMAEDHVKGVLRKLPPELRLFEKQFEAIRRHGAYDVNVFAEESWCFDRDWKGVTWNDWDNVWLRIKMDLCGIDEHNVLVPVDHKTGKYREYELQSYLEQLEIYALGGMLRFPDVIGASPRLWFLDEGITYPQDVDGSELYYPRSELPALQKKWLNRVKPMFNDKTFKPTPNNKCQYCAYSKAKGGTCKY